MQRRFACVRAARKAGKEESQEEPAADSKTSVASEGPAFKPASPMKLSTAPQAGDYYGALSKLEHFQVSHCHIGKQAWCPKGPLLYGKPRDSISSRLKVTCFSKWYARCCQAPVIILAYPIIFAQHRQARWTQLEAPQQLLAFEHEHVHMGLLHSMPARHSTVTHANAHETEQAVVRVSPPDGLPSCSVDPL